MVLGLALLLIFITFTTNHLVSRDRVIKHMGIESNKAFYLAEAGVERLLWHLAQDYYWAINIVSGETAEGSYTARLLEITRVEDLPQEPDDPQGLLEVTIESLGQYGKSRERIVGSYRIYYSLDPYQVFFQTLNWQRVNP